MYLSQRLRNVLTKAQSEADRLKDEFINIAAHELRTPIMPILGGLELIESKLSSVDSSIKEELAIISRNAERLLKLSEDILQASRIETGRLKLYIEQLNLNTLVSEVITDVEQKYKQVTKAPAVETADMRSLIMHIVGERADSNSRNVITFEPHEPTPMIECDRGKVGEVLFNVIDNAVKFIDEREGSIVVSTRLSGPNVMVSVRDNGIGIDRKVIDAGGRAGHHGLPGMHERANMVGGKLVVWSELNSGTEAELSIPASVAYAKSSVARRRMFWGRSA